MDYCADADKQEGFNSSVSDNAFDYIQRKTKSQYTQKPTSVSHLSEMSKYTEYSAGTFNNGYDDAEMKKQVLFKI
jgi:hypothetical protein